MYRFVFLTLLFLPLLSVGEETVTNTQIKQFVKRSSLSFVENKGQVKDQYGNERNDIDFKLKAGDGLSVFIGRNGLQYQWSNYIKSQILNHKSQKLKENIPNKPLAANDAGQTSEMYRMDVELIGVDVNCKAEAEEQQDYYEQYYTPPFDEKGILVHSYKKITYRNIYPNIDWTIYIRDGKPEYDFIVHPGGDVKNIRLKYGGAEHLAVSKPGIINAITPFGTVTEGALYCYEQETKKSVAAEYVVNKNIVGYNVDNYKQTLVIDPSLQWATYFGGTNADEIYGISCNYLNNIYVAGVTSSTGNIATVGAYQMSLSAGPDAFLAKFTASGALLWASYYGGSGAEEGDGIACDIYGNVLLTGWTASSNGIASAGSYQTALQGGVNAFLVKFNSSGSRQWGTYFGGNNAEEGIAVACDNTGNVYITGSTFSTNYIATAGAYQTTYGGSGDCFIAKFNANGGILWATYYGGVGQDEGQGIVCNDSGQVYITGFTNSSGNIATSGVYQSIYGGGTDAFLAKFDGSGNRLWCTYFGGSGYDAIDDGYIPVTVDKKGNIYIAGLTNSTSNIASSGAYQTSLGGGTDAFLAKFNNVGQLAWSTYYGGSGDDKANGISIRYDGSIFIAGRTQSTSSIATANGYQTVLHGTEDAFLARFNRAGMRKWGTYYGGSNDEVAYGVTTDSNGAAYIAGATNSINLPVTSGCYQSTLSSNYDGFIAKFVTDTIVYITQPYTDTSFCVGDTLSLAYKVSDTFLTGNIFTAQLSDSSGSFSNAVNIGTINVTTAGHIFCTIPSVVIPGADYRICIIASSPADTSEDEGLNIHIFNFTSLTAGSNTPVCPGDSILLHANSTVTGIHWQWTGPNGFYDTLQNTFRTQAVPADSGNYIVSATSGVCIVKDTVIVHIRPTPLMPVAGSNSPVCVGDSLKLTISNPQTGATYSWTGPNTFSSSAQNPVRTNVPFIDSGKYRVRATLNGCSSAYDSIYVVINPIITPTVNITSAPVVIPAGHTDTFTAHVNSGCYNPQYQWYINGIKINGATGNPYYTTLAAGDHISVTVHCSGCVNPDSAVSNLLTTGIVSSLLKGELNVCPNPFNESLTISNIPLPALRGEPVKVNIYNIVGQLVYSNVMTTEQTIIDTHNFSKGTYMLELISSDGEKVMRKVVKE